MLSQQEVIMQKLLKIESSCQSHQRLASTPQHYHLQSDTVGPNQRSPLPPPAFHPPAIASSSQISQPKKLVSKGKALPSGAIEETLSDVDDVFARYPTLRGSKLPTLAVKLAKEAFFEKKLMKQCTPLGGRELPGLPTAELSKLKEALFSRNPQYWNNIADFEAVWSECIASIGQACKDYATIEYCYWDWNCNIQMCMYIQCNMPCYDFTLILLLF